MGTQATVSVTMVKIINTPEYQIQNVTVTNGGSGYTSGSITFSNTVYTATCNFSNGSLASVTVNNNPGTTNPSLTATISAPNITPVNNTSLQAVSNQLGLNGSQLNAANKTYIDSNTGQSFTTAPDPNLLRL